MASRFTKINGRAVLLPPQQLSRAITGANASANANANAGANAGTASSTASGTAFETTPGREDASASSAVEKEWLKIRKRLFES